MFIKLILFLHNKGVDFFRFDAVAFIWKRLDTSCINLDQTHAIVRLFRTILNLTNKNCKIVTETIYHFMKICHILVILMKPTSYIIFL